ncbi:hypothetical protein PR048_027593 [Dryococelus australis]|uniref:Uncharacterized protein n=1 Tax=Dryococelus australis TaxID=614101 RepID=A0ABQ9GGZ3_9NEOP|nr:hypothetical protein PR048_027593 [Dryococelus australis]
MSRGRGGSVVRHYRAGSLPDFRTWESYRTMPLVGGFSRGSPVSPALSFQRCSILTSIHAYRLTPLLRDDEDAACRRIFTGIPPPPGHSFFIPALLLTQLASLSTSLKTSLLRACQISSLAQTIQLINCRVARPWWPVSETDDRRLTSRGRLRCVRPIDPPRAHINHCRQQLLITLTVPCSGKRSTSCFAIPRNSSPEFKHRICSEIRPHPESPHQKRRRETLQSRASFYVAWNLGHSLRHEYDIKRSENFSKTVFSCPEAVGLTTTRKIPRELSRSENFGRALRILGKYRGESRRLVILSDGCQAGKQLANSWHAPGIIAGPEVTPLT